ncbi:DUF4376 domain-containing protein [Vibrio tasmaniensis 1F-187]|uniref:DUF4376 domain-containing protein n=1 Tax=unclassified Vibrio TaxID=2614977 RepID=UPI00036F05D9|nr:DUF4376 domain-containing protein [Vibrio tasmaniensis]OEF71165.1 hypothetical protein A152_15320 [Vibrio tasmaniensis 1F-187]
MNEVAHHYNPSTLLYTHSTALSVPAGYKTPLVPQCALLAPLPSYDPSTQDLKANVKDCEWQVLDKFKEVTAYHKQTQIHKEFDDKSLVTDEYTIKKPPTPYHDFVGSDWVPNKEKALNAKRAEINNWRAALEGQETQTVVAIDGEWDAGPSARLRIDSTLLTAVMPPYWTDANNVDHEGMTLEELKQVKIAISELGFAIHDRQRTMKKEVEALTDFDEILNYPVGWPQS